MQSAFGMMGNAVLLSWLLACAVSARRFGARLPPRLAGAATLETGQQAPTLLFGRGTRPPDSTITSTFAQFARPHAAKVPGSVVDTTQHA